MKRGAWPVRVCVHAWPDQCGHGWSADDDNLFHDASLRGWRDGWQV